MLSKKRAKNISQGIVGTQNNEERYHNVGGIQRNTPKNKQGYGHNYPNDGQKESLVNELYFGLNLRKFFYQLIIFK
jgi:hypothetical protein